MKVNSLHNEVDALTYIDKMSIESSALVSQVVLGEICVNVAEADMLESQKLDVLNKVMDVNEATLEDIKSSSKQSLNKVATAIKASLLGIGSMTTKIGVIVKGYIIRNKDLATKVSKISESIKISKPITTISDTAATSIGTNFGGLFAIAGATAFDDNGINKAIKYLNKAEPLDLYKYLMKVMDSDTPQDIFADNKDFGNASHLYTSIFGNLKVSSTYFSPKGKLASLIKSAKVGFIKSKLGFKDKLIHNIQTIGYSGSTVIMAVTYSHKGTLKTKFIKESLSNDYIDNFVKSTTSATPPSAKLIKKLLDTIAESSAKMNSTNFTTTLTDFNKYFQKISTATDMSKITQIKKDLSVNVIPAFIKSIPIKHASFSDTLRAGIKIGKGYSDFNQSTLKSIQESEDWDDKALSVLTKANEPDTTTAVNDIRKVAEALVESFESGFDVPGGLLEDVTSIAESYSDEPTTLGLDLDETLAIAVTETEAGLQASLDIIDVLTDNLENIELTIAVNEGYLGTPSGVNGRDAHTLTTKLALATATRIQVGMGWMKQGETVDVSEGVVDFIKDTIKKAIEYIKKLWAKIWGKDVEDIEDKVEDKVKSITDEYRDLITKLDESNFKAFNWDVVAGIFATTDTKTVNDFVRVMLNKLDDKQLASDLSDIAKTNTFNKRIRTDLAGHGFGSHAFRGKNALASQPTRKFVYVGSDATSDTFLIHFVTNNNDTPADLKLFVRPIVSLVEIKSPERTLDNLTRIFFAIDNTEIFGVKALIKINKEFDSIIEKLNENDLKVKGIIKGMRTVIQVSTRVIETRNETKLKWCQDILYALKEVVPDDKVVSEAETEAVNAHETKMKTMSIHDLDKDITSKLQDAGETTSATEAIIDVLSLLEYRNNTTAEINTKNATELALYNESTVRVLEACEDFFNRNSHIVDVAETDDDFRGVLASVREATEETMSPVHKFIAVNEGIKDMWDKLITYLKELWLKVKSFIFGTPEAEEIEEETEEVIDNLMIELTDGELSDNSLSTTDKTLSTALFPIAVIAGNLKPTTVELYKALDEVKKLPVNGNGFIGSIVAGYKNSKNTFTGSTRALINMSRNFQSRLIIPRQVSSLKDIKYRLISFDSTGAHMAYEYEMTMNNGKTARATNTSFFLYNQSDVDEFVKNMGIYPMDLNAFIKDYILTIKHSTLFNPSVIKEELAKLSDSQDETIQNLMTEGKGDTLEVKANTKAAKVGAKVVEASIRSKRSLLSTLGEAMVNRIPTKTGRLKLLSKLKKSGKVFNTKLINAFKRLKP